MFIRKRQASITTSLDAGDGRGRAALIPTTESHTSTVDNAVRLAAALGISERVWLGLQADHDLEEAHRSLGKAFGRIGRIAAFCGERIVPVKSTPPISLRK
ncbi:MAG: hypothetical protein ABIR27_08105 [Dokdonella sp.]